MGTTDEVNGAYAPAPSTLELAWTAEHLARGLVQAVNDAPLQSEPFDHVYMPMAWPPSAHARLLTNLPGPDWFHPLRHGDALRPDGSSTRQRMYLYPETVARLPRPSRDVWLPVAHALRSDALQGAIVQKFHAALAQRFGRGSASLRFFPVPILLRDLPGYRIGVHADARSKAITMQFYLPQDRSQQHLGTVLHEGRDADGAARQTRLPFVPGAGYAFPVTPGSWHSVPTTTAADGERLSMMVTYYVQDSAKTWLMRRYDRLRCYLGVGPRG